MQLFESRAGTMPWRFSWSDPAGSGSAPQSPDTYPEPSPDRTINDAFGACPPCPQPFPEHAIIRIPSGHNALEILLV
ncbi:MULTISPECIES: hypothetical protein [unclassified Sphingobacterium]|uniref:hypothetical protein n=1 Tax=unclassified Sphingobacterium TaxID=2609468 RepID=UPI0020C59796|nr:MULTISPECIES: hypothetical protein [unclassified Sphingobacterium]